MMTWSDVKLSAALATAAVLAVGPWWRCSVIDNWMDAFVLHHPRSNFFANTVICFGVVLLVMWGKGPAARPVSRWCIVPMVLVAWLAFEALGRMQGHLPRGVNRYGPLLLWVMFG